MRVFYPAAGVRSTWRSRRRSPGCVRWITSSSCGTPMSSAAHALLDSRDRAPLLRRSRTLRGPGAVGGRLRRRRGLADRAIGLAGWLFDSVRRLGDLMATDLSRAQRQALERSDLNQQIQLIDVKVKTDYLGHGYFISNPSVLSDLILVLRDGLPPGAEFGRPLVRREDGFWELREGYPNVQAKEVGRD